MDGRWGRANSEEAGGGRSVGRRVDKEACGGSFAGGGREMLAEAEERVAVVYTRSGGRGGRREGVEDAAEDASSQGEGGRM
jgi:hypothetical protein